MGTMIYIFAGWTIYAAMKHPYFSNPMIYLPLILLGIDKIYKKQKPYVFIWSVALAGLSNFYFFYMLGIFMVLYAIFRYFDLFADRSIKNIGKWLGIFAVYSVIAVLIAAVILLPVILPVFGTDRFKAENYVPLFYDRIYYEKYLGCLIGENMIQWGVAGYTAVSLAGVFVLFSKKKEVHRTQGWFCTSECVFAAALCRACPEWIFLRFQSLDLGLWNADRVHLCKNIPGTFCSYAYRKAKSLCDASDLLYSGAHSGGGKDTAQPDGDGSSVTFDIYRAFLRKYFYQGAKSYGDGCRFPDRRHPV